MKKYHIWAIGELGILLLVAGSQIISYYTFVYVKDWNWIFSLTICIIAFFSLTGAGWRWFHKNTTLKEKFYNGDDDYK